MQLDIGAGCTNSNHRNHIGNAKHGQDADADSEIPPTYAMTKANARAVRKRGGSSRWAQKLCHVIEGFIDAARRTPPMIIAVRLRRPQWKF